MRSRNSFTEVMTEMEMLNLVNDFEGQETLPTFAGGGSIIGMQISRSGESSSMYSPVSTRFEASSGVSSEFVEETPHPIRCSGAKADITGDGGESDTEGDGYEFADVFDRSIHENLQEKECNEYKFIEDCVGGDDFDACILTEPSSWAKIFAGGRYVGVLSAGASAAVGAAAGSTVTVVTAAAPGVPTEEPPAVDGDGIAN